MIEFSDSLLLPHKNSNSKKFEFIMDCSIFPSQVDADDVIRIERTNVIGICAVIMRDGKVISSKEGFDVLTERLEKIKSETEGNNGKIE